MTPEKRAFYIFHHFYKIGNLTFDDALKCSRIVIENMLFEFRQDKDKTNFWVLVSKELERLAQ
jgi:hypothetical protein